MTKTDKGRQDLSCDDQTRPSTDQSGQFPVS
jgi:hypothetical protein